MDTVNSILVDMCSRVPLQGMLFHSALLPSYISFPRLIFQLSRVGMNSWDLSKLAKVGFGVDIEDLKGRSLEDYGKSVVVTEEEFQRSMNPNKKMAAKVKGQQNQPGSIKGSQFLKTFSPEQRQKLLECFKKYSTSKTVKKPPRSRLNANGVREVVFREPETNVTVQEQELGKLFQDAGIPLHPHTLSNIYNQLSKSKGQGAGFDEIMKLLDLPNGSLDQEQDYRQIFAVYDRRGRGYFQFQDYKLVCEGVTKDLAQVQMRQAFRGMDLKGDGRIGLDIFIKVMKGQH